MGRVSTAKARLIEAAIELIWQDSLGTVTVDAICDKANVKKGSFYHFFASKDELVLAALDANWESRRPVLDRIFSATEPPLDRLRNYFKYVYTRQMELKGNWGCFVGCFYTAVGMGCAKQNPEIARKVQSILANYTRYYESALRDAVASGAIDDRDVSAQARSLFAYMEGVLAQARIRNDTEILRTLGKSAFEFLGISEGRRRVDR